MRIKTIRPEPKHRATARPLIREVCLMGDPDRRYVHASLNAVRRPPPATRGGAPPVVAQP